MKLLYKLLRQDPNTREGIISTTSVLGILVNILISVIKVVLGLLTSSIAIISEGINNATDALSAVLIFVGAKLAKKHPDEKHPFGYGRVEYLTSLVISILILVSGAEVLTGSIEKIVKPADLKISYISLAIVAASAVIKYVLGVYIVKMGKKAGSTALEGVGVDSKSDSYVSLVTIVSAIVFLVFHFSVDAYAGVITSLVILKAGFGLIKDTVSELLGRPGEEELAKDLYKQILSTDGIVNAADLMLHNYGPNAYSGSVNVEMGHDKTVGEIYQVLHKLQLEIMHKKNVTMVFGVYAVDNGHEYVREMRKRIGSFVKEKEHVKNFHAVYLEPNSDKIYCDLVVDYDLRDWDGLKREFLEFMKAYYPENSIELTIETEFV